MGVFIVLLIIIAAIVLYFKVPRVKQAVNGFFKSGGGDVSQKRIDILNEQLKKEQAITAALAEKAKLAEAARLTIAGINKERDKQRSYRQTIRGPGVK